MVICTGSNMANVNFNNANLSNCHFNCSVLTKAWMFNIRLYRVNFDEASVQEWAFPFSVGGKYPH